MTEKGSMQKRRTYFIKKAFQAKMIFRFIILIILGAVISGVILYVFAASELQTSLFDAHMQIRNTWDILLPSIIVTHVTVVVLISLATVYIVLYLSHKIAGPLYRFERIAEAVGEGNFNVHVRLREGDELLPLQAAFEVMVDNVQERFRTFRQRYDEIRHMQH